ncbi:hypothetical protein M0804_012687 [Polistes exclamans]|nr:hypothetical protein M0804_012687 [Polistes exclamans]
MNNFWSWYFDLKKNVVFTHVLRKKGETSTGRRYFAREHIRKMRSMAKGNSATASPVNAGSQQVPAGLYYMRHAPATTAATAY